MPIGDQSILQRTLAGLATWAGPELGDNETRMVTAGVWTPQLVN